MHGDAIIEPWDLGTSDGSFAHKFLTILLYRIYFFNCVSACSVLLPSVFSAIFHWMTINIFCVGLDLSEKNSPWTLSFLGLGSL